MAASICPHCGSKYITFSEKKDSFEKTNKKTKIMGEETITMCIK